MIGSNIPEEMVFQKHYRQNLKSRRIFLFDGCTQIINMGCNMYWQHYFNNNIIIINNNKFAETPSLLQRPFLLTTYIVNSTI
jgi:hypothetical protein